VPKFDLIEFPFLQTRHPIESERFRSNRTVGPVLTGSKNRHRAKKHEEHLKFKSTWKPFCGRGSKSHHELLSEAWPLHKVQETNHSGE